MRTGAGATESERVTAYVEYANLPQLALSAGRLSGEKPEGTPGLGSRRSSIRAGPY